jgi:hypothetical protein
MAAGLPDRHDPAGAVVTGRGGDSCCIRSLNRPERLLWARGLSAGALLVMHAYWPILCRVSGLRFNRARYDADTAMTAFAAGLKDAMGLDSIRDDLATVVH